MCETPGVEITRGNEDDPIDESLLDCFLDLGLKERIQSAANYANAVDRLRRVRPAPASD